MRTVKKGVLACLIGFSLCGASYAGFVISPELLKEAAGGGKAKEPPRQAAKPVKPAVAIETVEERIARLEKEMVEAKQELERAQEAMRATLGRLEEINKLLDGYNNKKTEQALPVAVESSHSPSAETASEQKLAPLPSSSEFIRVSNTSSSAQGSFTATRGVSVDKQPETSSVPKKASGAYSLGTTGYRQVPFSLPLGELSGDQFLEKVLPKGYKIVFADGMTKGAIVIHDEDPRTWFQWLDYAAKQTENIIRVSYRRALVYLSK